VHDGRLLSALLECSRRFPEPEVTESSLAGPVIYETEVMNVEAALVDHTVPCLAFALVEGPRRIAYITDTAWSEAARPGLLRLAHRANRLYCDAFYAQAQSALAAKYRHMTAPQAGELAHLAEVEELVLIHFASRYHGRYETLVDEARAIFPRVSAVI
jgi:ribonuclease BN (tRNA processing enzyme)